jgi:hypothetical protein
MTGETRALRTFRGDAIYLDVMILVAYLDTDSICSSERTIRHSRYGW